MVTADWVAYLDDVSHLDFMAVVKREITDLLDLHPGDLVLDAGCGTGDDSRAMAGRVSPGGEVTGLDIHEAILVEARRRNEESDLPVRFVSGDVQHLDIADGAFTRCRSERMFQHVTDQHAAMRELARVLRPGGIMVVYDADWETLIIDADDWQTTRALMNVAVAKHRHGWIGRMLPGLMVEAGLEHIEVLPRTLMIRDLAQAEHMHTLQRTAKIAMDGGEVTAPAAQAWFADLRRRDAEGRFFCAVTTFIVRGHKPARS